MIGAVIAICVPVFGCMIVGFLLVRVGLIGMEGVDILNRLVYYAAFPALLFAFLARTPIEQIWQSAFIELWILSLGIMYAVVFLVSRLLWRSDTAEASVRGMNCSCSSTAFMGVPLLVIAFGQDQALPAILATVVIVTVFFGLTFALIEFSRHGMDSSGRALYLTIRSLSRNPLILGVVLGVLSSAFLTLPKPILSLAELVGSAAIPCSLITIGMFVAGQKARESVEGTLGPTLLKLVLHPLVTWGLLRWVIDLDPARSSAAMLLAALPPANSCFVVAKQYGVLAAETSGMIWLSTALSVLSITAILFFWGVHA
jgi:malonate transporter